MSIQTLIYASEFSGLIYLFCWSAFFYPQIIMFYKQKSCYGLNVDFMAYQIVEFTAYSIYTCFGYFDEDAVGIVDIADILFAVHALACILVMIGQMNFYGTGGQKLSKICIVLNSVLIFLSILFFVLEQTDAVPGNSQWNILVWFGYVTLLMQVLSYTPQVIHICNRQSTQNFACMAIGFDTTGGVFSMAQMFIDQIIEPEEETFNWSKFLLALIWMSYDFIFYFQFWYYRGLDPKQDLEELEELELDVLSIEDDQDALKLLKTDSSSQVVKD